MILYKTSCAYGYSILGERPPQLDVDAEYIIVGQSKYFPCCTIIQRADGHAFLGKKRWIISQQCLYRQIET